jgi:type VI secretion system secreted protein Hcp
MNRFVYILLLVCFSLCQLNGAVTGYLKIGDISGESQVAGHEDEIDIHDISWGVARPLVDATGSTRTRATAKFEDLIVAHRIDKSTPKLMEACASGKTFPEIEIILRRDSGDEHLDYLIITLTKATVTSYSLNGGGSEGPPAAMIGFNYEEVKVVYNVANQAGSVEMTWNVVENTP